jgi:hypothetical protein
MHGVGGTILSVSLVSAATPQEMDKSVSEETLRQPCGPSEVSTGFVFDLLEYAEENAE